LIGLALPAELSDSERIWTTYPCCAVALIVSGAPAIADLGRLFDQLGPGMAQNSIMVRRWLVHFLPDLVLVMTAGTR
jgi:hypothetical protein